MKGQPALFNRLVDCTAVVLEVVGEVDYSNTAAFEAAILDAAVRGEVTIDLTRTDYLDSSGVRSLFWVANHGVRMVVVAPPTGLVRRTLQMVGLDRVATLVDQRRPDGHHAAERPDGARSRPRRTVP